MLGTRMLVATHTIKNLLDQIKKIEENINEPDIKRLSQIRKIKDEITKVGTEVDNIKKSITILNTCKSN
jgi:hypothetical protein